MSRRDTVTRALSEPGVWVELRRDLATANMVTEIRGGKHSDLPPSEFEARSFRITARGVTPVRYGIEVRYAPNRPDTTKREHVEAAVREAMEAAIPQIVSRIIAGVGQ